MMQSHDDMCLMSQLNQDGILSNLTQRYQEDQIYTSIGPTLISLNPYKDLPTLFSQEVVDELREVILAGNVPKHPHIYAIAGHAFQGMINQIEKQAIIISGESGAGKTECTKYCMQMLTNLSQHQGHQHPIETKILSCNPILEAFGNSKTARNENSSRFGKYVQIYFGPDHKIKGSNIKSYLLEKSRVTNIAPNERSFHIFYAICAAGVAGARKPEAYRFLNQSECYKAQGIEDASYFTSVTAAMGQLGFSQSDQGRIWKLLLTILQLGNIEFDDSQREKNQSLPCVIVYEAPLTELAGSLGITSDQLREMLLYRKIMIPRQECILKAMDRIECMGNLNTLCKAIYNSIFEWILTKLQTVLNPPVEEEQLYRSFKSSLKISKHEPAAPVRFEINILDIFGFQNFKENSLEQLCINYTNEKLLDLYNRCVFDNQLSILREDGLESQIDNIQAPSNDGSVCLLDAIFRTIKDKTRFRQSKDQDMVWEFKTNPAKSEHIRTITYDKFDENIFIVTHSPCQVAYNVTNFKLKNQDQLTAEIENITISLFHNQKKMQSGRTLLEKFTNEINSLTYQLESAANHYVRCIKPNEEKRNLADREFILRQIRYMGVFETIEIRKRIFPYRKTYEEMANLLEPIFKEANGRAPRAAVEIFLNQLKAMPHNYLLGTRRIYMKEELEQKLNKRLIEYDKVRIECINKIKRHYKRYKVRESFRATVYGVIQTLKIYKKWGRKIEKLMFCCFQEIAEKAKERQLEEENLQFQRELGEEIDKLTDLERQQSNEEPASPLKAIHRLIVSTEESNSQERGLIVQPIQQEILSQIGKIQEELQEKDEKIVEESRQVEEMRRKQMELEQVIERSREKEAESEKKIQEVQTTIETVELAIKQLQETVNIKEEETTVLSQQLQLKDKENEQLAQKLKEISQKYTQLRNNPHLRVHENIEKTTEPQLASGANNQQDSPMKHWQEVQQEMKELQQKANKKTEQLQTVTRQSTSKVKQLEDMVISLEDIVRRYKAKTEQSQTVIEEVNQKLYKKCLDYEDLLKRYHQEQKKTQEGSNSERLRSIAKETIDKLRSSLTVSESQRKELEQKFEDLLVQNMQYKRLVEGYKGTGGDKRRSSDLRLSCERSEVRETTQQQLFSMILGYKVGKSKQHLLNIRQKVSYILP